jgi:preprotein translocase subunit Sss1
MDEKSLESLSVKAKEWYELEEKYRGQIEKACYAGIVIIWIFTSPVLSNTLTTNPEKLQFLQLLIFSLVCFITPLILYLALHFNILISNYNRYKRNKNIIEEEKRILKKAFAKPYSMALWNAGIGFILVILGYILIGVHIFFNIF